LNSVGRNVVVLAIKALEVIFALGILGSALVVVLTGVEDLKAVFSKKTEPRGQMNSTGTRAE
jgi:hypothetical protein